MLMRTICYDTYGTIAPRQPVDLHTEGLFRVYFQVVRLRQRHMCTSLENRPRVSCKLGVNLPSPQCNLTYPSLSYKVVYRVRTNLCTATITP